MRAGIAKERVELQAGIGEIDRVAGGDHAGGTSSSPSLRWSLRSR
jgi:hypothetical protein